MQIRDEPRDEVVVTAPASSIREPGSIFGRKKFLMAPEWGSDASQKREE